MVASCVKPDCLVNYACILEDPIILLPLVLKLSRPLSVFQLGICYVTCITEGSYKQIDR